MESLVPLQPALHPFMLVGRVVIADQVDFFACGNGSINHAQKPQPFLMAVLLLAQAVDLAASGVASREPRGCAVALIVMRHGGAAALLHRQARLRAIQCLDLALLIY